MAEIKCMRPSTLQDLGLGTVLEIFRNGKLPVDVDELVSKVFGPPDNRGSLLVSGGSGIVGAGKVMQLGARLLEYSIRILTLDMPNAPDGIGQQYPGLRKQFGPEKAAAIMANIIRFSYDGRSLPEGIDKFRPAVVFEAIPENLGMKQAHYKMLRDKWPDITILSATSGFPASELGFDVKIFHPAFPHHINKVWEVVEDEPSDITRLFLALGMVPVRVSDNWSFVLDVLFCGLTLAASRHHEATNMPFPMVDKFIRKYFGPNPFRAHDAIGPGASFLTWSCMHHLAKVYGGGLFEPSDELTRRKESGEKWYSSSRPIVKWPMDDSEKSRNFITGALLQMTSVMLHENRASLPIINAMGEICAQFTKGIIALARSLGPEGVAKAVATYHKKHPAAKDSPWYPEVFGQMDTPEWKQLCVNAEHDGTVGVITISRETLNQDVMDELNRAIDWLKDRGIKRVILTGDFHLSTQMVGADTSEFFACLKDEDEGFRVSSEWSSVARRFHDEFDVSVGFVNGKRCLGGMLELMTHCHCLVSVDSAKLGFPEVTLPVVPGMEACHWPLRKTDVNGRQKLLGMLLTGKPVKAKDAVGWLVDFAGPEEEALQKAWHIAAGGDHGIALRSIAEYEVNVPDAPKLPDATSTIEEEGRRGIINCVWNSCETTLAKALEVQARHCAGFLIRDACRMGAIGSNAKKIMDA